MLKITKTWIHKKRGCWAAQLLGIAFSQCCGVAWADSQLIEEERVYLPPMVVVASKQPRPREEVAGSVRVIDASDARDQLSRDLDQLFRYQPGISMTGAGTRFGSTGVNIRGVGGNRVAIEVDGVPVSDQFDIGNFSNAARGGVDTFFLQRAEILSGPASSLYGSDALGGILSLSTWDPLAGRAHQLSARARLGWDGADHGRVVAALGNWTAEQSGLLIGYSSRAGHTLDNRANTTVQQDPRDWQQHAGLFKWSMQLAPEHALQLSARGKQRQQTTQIGSLLGLGRFRSTTSLTGEDEINGHTVQLDYQGSLPGRAEEIKVQLYSQESEFDQLSLERRDAAAVPISLRRHFLYQQAARGVEANLFGEITAGSLSHRWGVGLEFQQIESDELRDAIQTTLSDGSQTRTVLGEEFPVRDFPLSQVDETGLFIYDEIQFGLAPVILIPGLRYDRFDLQPRPDDIFLQDNPQVQPVAIKASAWSPRLGVIVELRDNASLFLQYAHGFRAPPHNDANIGLDIPMFNIRAVPNPDLVPEESDGLEFGWRQFSATRQASLSAFYTRYDNFIESRVPVGVDPESNTLLFQSRNLNRAHIYGLEFDLQQSLASWGDSLADWTLVLRGFWAEGEDRSTGEGLNSLSPPQLIAGIGWEPRPGRVKVRLMGTHTWAKDDIDESDGMRFRPSSHTVLDLLLDWELNPHARLNLGLFNLTDRRYWRWADVAGFAPDEPIIDLLSRPGRHLSIGLDLDW